MTRPDHPRPEVAALATALWNAGEVFISEVGIMHGSPTDSSVMVPAEMLAEAIPAPFAIVDMDALTERVAQAMSGYGNPTIDWHREARRLLGGGRT